MDKLELAKKLFFEGLELISGEDYENAEQKFREAHSLVPDRVSVLTNLSLALLKQGKFSDSKKYAELSVELDDKNAEGWLNLGVCLQKEDNAIQALESCDKAIALNPDYAEAWSNRGAVLHDLKRHDDALVSCDKALALKPDHVEAWLNLGVTLHDLTQLDEALASYDKAIALNPDYAEAWSNRGVVLHDLKCFEEALASYDKALALKPDNAEARFSLGVTLQGLKRFEEALASYDKALALNADMPYALGNWLLTTMFLCDWKGLDAACDKITKRIDTGDRASTPFPVLAIPSSLAQQRKCADIYIQDKFPANPCLPPFGEKYAHDRIRIGYFSADFHNHATAYLMAELFELHDRSKVEVIGFSYGVSSSGAMRKRLETAFDRFIDVSAKTDQEIALLARTFEIDIAIDLKGFTQDSRTGIFAMRPAPVQVNYLGYPGTMGADYIDYLIADPTLIPPEHIPHYSEKIVYLPHTYQVNDSHRKISDRGMSRKDAGLPKEGFVFCCFNSNFKITPDVFAVWMRLLQKVEGSVLWLFEGDSTAASNLRQEAKKRGISADRLVFAERMDLSDHLARYRLADVFLDTLYCNAHTTASDALWAGLPVLTCLGETFAGRVAASLLNAIGLPELIARSHDEYESLALALATDPQRLSAIKQKLAQNRTTHPLFDTALFTRHIESAYAAMWERHQAGLSPDHIHVPD